MEATVACNAWCGRGVVRWLGAHAMAIVPAGTRQGGGWRWLHPRSYYSALPLWQQ